MTYSLPVAAQYARNLGLARAAYVPSRARSFDRRRPHLGRRCNLKLCRAARNPKGGICYCLQCRFARQNGGD